MSKARNRLVRPAIHHPEKGNQVAPMGPQKSDRPQLRVKVVDVVAENVRGGIVLHQGRALIVAAALKNVARKVGCAAAWETEASTPRRC